MFPRQCLIKASGALIVLSNINAALFKGFMPYLIFKEVAPAIKLSTVSPCLINNLADTRVGDTVTDAKNPTAEPLPGY